MATNPDAPRLVQFTGAAIHLFPIIIDAHAANRQPSVNVRQQNLSSDPMLFAIVSGIRLPKLCCAGAVGLFLGGDSLYDQMDLSSRVGCR
jgi:hypothetical protein